MIPLLKTAQRPSLFEPVVVLEHVSESGPTATHARGTLISGSQQNLRELGVYEQYLELLPRSAREKLTCVLAASWIPIELALTHYQTCEALQLETEQVRRVGELTAARMVKTFAGAAMRVVRSAGADSYWLLLKNNDRFYDRLYQGGGVTLLQTGPKDLVLENHGQPLAACRFWRTAYLAYMEAFGRAFAKVSFVKLVHPRIPGPHSIAVAGSWV